MRPPPKPGALAASKSYVGIDSSSKALSSTWKMLSHVTSTDARSNFADNFSNYGEQRTQIMISFLTAAPPLVAYTEAAVKPKVTKPRRGKGAAQVKHSQ